ncbi:DNAase [Candidatus Endoriftia persephone str. Guaymas]|nr:DNAase [Candidatus Endoriftia persephone str. Guaymas]
MGLQPRLIDSHSHFDDQRFDGDREAALQRAHAAGVTSQIIAGIKAEWWPRQLQVCRDYPGLHPAYGLHPMFVAEHQRSHLEQLAEWVRQERPVAIGECGLDLFIDNPQPRLQQFYFEAQLELAHHYQLPVIIHARRAVEACINTLKQFPGLHGVFHSYSGSKQQAHRLIEMGFSFSFGGPITYERANKLRRLVQSLPLESILLETDSPDQPLSQHRGERNEPAYLPLVLQTLAQLRNEDPQQIAQQTRCNTEQLFGLGAPP